MQITFIKSRTDLNPAPAWRWRDAHDIRTRTRMGDRTMTDDPDNPTTIGGWIRSFLLARQIEAGYTDQAAIDQDYERLTAAEDAAAAAAWEQMRADGVPVAQPQTE